ncbi:MAG: hypothetical protein ACYC4Q_00565 [Victivallaceae bacterium]
MNNVNERIEKLYESVSKEEKNFSSSLNKALLLYIFIIIVLAGYTVFLNFKIQELATPTNLAIALNTRIKDSIPHFASQIKDQMKPGAKQLADKTVESAHALIPKAAEFAKTQIEFYVNDAMSQIEREHLVALQKIFEDAVDEAMKNKDLVKDKNLGKALASSITQKIDNELKDIINNELFNSVDKLRADMESLRAKPVQAMTKNEYAEKKFVVYWLYLVDNAKTGNSNFSNVLNTVTVAAEKFCNKASNTLADIEVSALPTESAVKPAKSATK